MCSLRTPLLLLVTLSPGCHHVGGGLLGFGGGSAVAPALSGTARYVDVDLDGQAGPGDRVILSFDAPVVVNDPSVTALELSVDGDSFGAGATLVTGPGSQEISVVLGAGAVLRTRGLFDPAATSENSPSGLRIGDVSPDGIEHASNGIDVDSTAPLDLVPGPMFGIQSGLAGGAGDAAGADLNLDGLGDWVAADGANGVEVYESLPGGGYLGTNLGIAEARRVLLVELRGSGRLDVVVLTEDGVLAVYENLSQPGGPIVLASGQLLDTGEVGAEVADLDADGDGDPDLALAGAGGVHLIENEGAGFLGEPGEPLPGSPTDARALAVGDVDGDGREDLVVARDGENVLILGVPCATLGEPLAIPGEAPTRGVELADLDRDGEPDLLAHGEGGLAVWLGDGGNLVPAFELPGEPVGAARLADLDADGVLDVVLGESSAVRLLYGLGDGSFLDSGARLPVAGAVDVATGDADGDADVDLLLTSDGPPEAWHGSLQGTWGQSRLVETGEDVGDGHVFSLAAGDLDGDGDDDLILGDDVGLEVRTNLGDGTFDPTPALYELRDSRANGLAVADVDGDGDPDVVCALLGTAPSVWLNDGGGLLSPFGGPGEVAKVLSIDAGDLDGDGDVDLALGRVRGEADLVLLNRGNDCGGKEPGAWLGFDEPIELPGTWRTGELVLADFDADGDLDLLTAHEVPDRLFLNDGQANFTLAQQTFGQGRTCALVVADLDRDGDLDLVAGKNQQDEIWHNDGQGSFTLVSELVHGATSDVGGADMNGDGYTDLVVSRELPEGILVYWGTPDGEFSDPPEDPQLEQSVRRVQMMDVDRDGATEFVTGMGDETPNRLWRNL